MARKKQKGSRFLGGLLAWPLILGIFWIGLIVHLVLTQQMTAAMIAGGYFAVYLLCGILYLVIRRKRLQREMVLFAAE